MLNELITWVLNTYLGKYLEDFNPDQLSIALVSGEVELENVPIKKDALRSFGIPVEALSGSIGKIKLQIPVRQFRTSPWCIAIERVYGVFVPKDLNDWDNEKEKQDEYEYKINILDGKEASWRVENDCNVESYYSLSYSSWLNYGATLATNILENLELKITDIHLRYEDTVTVPNSPFSAGIRIQSITAQTCDANWIPGVKNNDINIISYKLLELKDLCFYWDKLHQNSMCSGFTSKDILLNMNNLCKLENHSFVINPINATAKFKRERCKQAIRSKNRPRISFDVTLPKVIVVLTEVQYEEILKCIALLQGIKRIRSFKISRPSNHIIKNAKIWWKYAAKCYGFNFRSSGEKWKIAKENIRYIKIYKRLLINPTENISKEEKQFKIDMEKLRNLDELKFLREISCKNVSAKELNMRSKTFNQCKGILYHWFPNWLGWYGNTSSGNDEHYEKMEDDILIAIKETIENDSFSNRDAIFANFKFALSDGRISLTSEQISDDMAALELEFENLTTFIEIKPKLTSYCVGISLGSVCLNDKLTKLTKFPYIVRPQIQENQKSLHSNFISIFSQREIISEKVPWFQLKYEKNPSEYQSDYRLTIYSKSLDVVYNDSTFQWLVRFFTKQTDDKKNFIYTIFETKNYEPHSKFFSNMKSVLMGQKDYRKRWSFEIDISAPRIICVGNFKDVNTSVFVIDFGRFQLFKNEPNSNIIALSKDNHSDMDSDDELFMTPCSTPPGSKVSPSDSPAVSTIHETLSASKIFINKDTGLENTLHSEIYDKYTINLTDLQVLVCKNSEYAYVCSKASSSFHLLDKFNISIHIERRIFNTSDPEYPAITLNGNLQKIVAHINEQKITESLKILNQITFGINKSTLILDNDVSYEDMLSNDSNEIKESSSNAIFEFVIGQMILEVQSKEKSIAELQIIGAKAGITKNVGKININMSVHRFLLVDAIQSFGHDFELLIASHHHIRMDSASGSLKESVQCSSINADSPDLNRHQSSHLNKNENDLHQGKAYDYGSDNALITIEINIVESMSDEETIQIANIAFNNLDVIANQETIVEILGFGKRIIDSYKLFKSKLKKKTKEIKTIHLKNTAEVNRVRTKFNFDFHRLNILVLRSTRIEDRNVGRKVGTLTMSEAKIHAELGKDFCVTGALGGIQIIDITPEGFHHQRIFSVGKDLPKNSLNLVKNDALYSLTNEMYGIDEHEFQYSNALSFKITQTGRSAVVVRIRMASVWYTHCPRFIEEIYVCVKEFRQYLKNFVKSLRNKATHMAKGLVQHTNPTQLNKIDNGLQDIAFDIILSTPVLVLPRSCKSTEVLVANLGKITASNKHENIENCPESTSRNTYFVDIKNVNLCSLSIDERNDIYFKVFPKANDMYACHKNAVPILYNTALMFQCVYESRLTGGNNLWDKRQSLLLDGRVTQNLDICLSRSQYEQLIESLGYATNITFLKKRNSKTENVNDRFEETVVADLSKNTDFDEISVKFSVPILKLELKNEHNISLIHIIFQEFCFRHRYAQLQKEVQVLLRSVIMEDLKFPKNSRLRNMVDSSSDDENINLSKNKLSSSCPDLSNFKSSELLNECSPINRNLSKQNTNDKSEYANTKVFKNIDIGINQKIKTDNLVIYKSLTTKNAGAEESKSSIDFNSLNLTISVEKWFMVFDFFGFLTNEVEKIDDHNTPNLYNTDRSYSKKELQVSIRSLNLILVRNEFELSKANISSVVLHVYKSTVIESIDGRLGSISLCDLTPYGYLYREKFTTSGTEALSFSYKSIL